MEDLKIEYKDITMEQSQELYKLLSEEEFDYQRNPLRYFQWDRIKGQKAFIYDTTSEKWLFSGKGYGKSTCMVINMIIHGTGEYPDDYPEEAQQLRKPIVILFITSSVERVAQIHIEKWMPKKCFRNGDFNSSYNSRTRILTLYRNGKVYSHIYLMTWDQELIAFKGIPQVNIAIMDEHGNRGKYEEIKARVRGLGFRQIIGGLTADEEQKGREELWEVQEIWDRRFERSDLVIHRGYTGENPFNGVDYIKRITENRTEQEKRILLWGDPLQLIGLLFKVEKRLHLRDYFEYRVDYPVWECIDPHDGKPTAITWFCMLPSKEGVFFDCLKIDGDIPQICEAMLDTRNKYKMNICKTLMDPSQVNRTNINNKTLIGNEFRRHSKNRIIVHSANNDILSGNMRIREWLSPGKITGHPRLTFAPAAREALHDLSRMSRDPKKNDKIDDFPSDIRYTLMDDPYYYYPVRRYNFVHEPRHISPRFRNAS